MKIKQVNIEEVIPYENNPRDNSNAVDEVAASLQEFGWQQPIVVDSNMVVLAGHTRLQAAKQLGMTKVPVQIALNLSCEQAKAYRIKDNRSAEHAEWVNELLMLEIEELAKAGYDTELTGFTDDDLANLLEPEEPKKQIAKTITHLPPAPPPDPPKPDPNSGLRDYTPPEFQPMDIIDLGPHTLTVGFEEAGLLKKIIKLVRKEAPKLAILLNGEVLPATEKA